MRAPCLEGVLIGVLLWSSTATADLAQDAQALQDDINDLVGTEYAGIEATFNLAVIGLDVLVTLQGLGFCAPTDPTASPDSNPTPPLNAYGCTNGAVVTAEAIPATTTALVTVTLSELFIDFVVERNTALACGEAPGGNLLSDGYFLADAVYEFTVDIIDTPECTVYEFVAGSEALAIGSYEFDTDDSCLLGFAGVVGGFLVSNLEQQLELLFTQDIVTYLAERNAWACQGTPVLPASWARVKSEF